MSTNKKQLPKTTNATKTDKKIKYDLSSFINSINDKLENSETLKYSVKNNIQLSLAKCDFSVNGNSAKSVPTDAYVRLKNNTQFQLQYNKRNNEFVGFNIRVCCDEHKKYFTDTYGMHFDSVSDNQRIYKSDYINGFELFNQIMNDLIELPIYNRGVLVNSAK